MHAVEVLYKQIRRQDLYFEVDKILSLGIVKYYLSKYSKPKMTWVVEFNKISGNMECTCMKLESKGIPFCNIFQIIVLEHMKRILIYCILKRWTRAVCSRQGDMKWIGGCQQSNLVVRFGTLSGMSNYCVAMLHNWKIVQII